MPSDYESIRLWAAGENRKPTVPEKQAADTNPQGEGTAQSSNKAKSGKGAQKSKQKGKQKEVAKDSGAIAQADTLAGPNTQDEGTHICRFQVSCVIDVLLTLSDELPVGWLPHWSVEHNAYFFYNTTTGDRTWNDPRLQ
ncbi:hypothetical protein FRC08_004491 [Ceratobasidium sp. 394]|nr:hypothetical protein FRC08_004491 [Ceratobasidium sp. 394]